MASKQQCGTAAEFILKADIRQQWHSAKVTNNDNAVEGKERRYGYVKKMLKKKECIRT